MLKQVSWFRRSRLALLGSVLVLGGTVMTAQSAEAPPPFKKDLSIDELMEAIVMPSADAIWKSTQVDVTPQGEKSSAPTNDAEWLALRHQAVSLVAVTELLLIPNLKVAKDPKSTKHNEGELSPVEITKIYKAAIPAFQAHATALHALALKALAAIDKRDLDAISEVGGDLDAECEACHLQFWYPNQAKQP
ncbi:MAG TPA: hypothetical protein VMH83_04320 [Candidatus Acidoferrum sp.]|nr:hypothetical protein [Candidatus Acidoferrum sp.]